MKKLIFITLNLLAASSVMAEDCRRDKELLSEAEIEVERLNEIGDCFYSSNEFAQAESWSLRASEEGSLYSQQRLGFMYHKGRGSVNQDFAKALHWYGKASEQGGGYASHGIASMYEFGEGVKPDKRKMVFYLKRSASQGYAIGQYHLALKYDYKGNGERSVPYSPESAFKWFNKAAQNGVTEAKTKVAAAYYYGWGVEDSFEKAYSWYLSAAEDGDAEAQFSLASMLEHGTSVPVNFKEAAHWFIKSAQQGHQMSMESIADFYLKGKGVEKNKDKAIEWYKKAGFSLLEIKYLTALE